MKVSNSSGKGAFIVHGRERGFSFGMEICIACKKKEYGIGVFMHIKELYALSPRSGCPCVEVCILI